jgi:hypothetical protein
MGNYEQRISDIESEMNKKCDEPRVREIEVYDFMCSSTIFLHLTQNHIVSDFDNISCSVFDFLDILYKNVLYNVGIPTVLHLTPRILCYKFYNRPISRRIKSIYKCERETIAYVIIKVKLGKSDTQKSRSI